MKKLSISEVTDRIKENPFFNGFVFDDENPTNQFATKDVGYKTFKECKDEYKLSNKYHLFIAHMYKGDKKREFLYLILSRKATVRLFRKHKSFDVEYNKLFASGNTVDKLIKSLKKYIEQGYILK